MLNSGIGEVLLSQALSMAGGMVEQNGVNTFKLQLIEQMKELAEKTEEYKGDDAFVAAIEAGALDETMKQNFIFIMKSLDKLATEYNNKVLNSVIPLFAKFLDVSEAEYKA